MARFKRSSREDYPGTFYGLNHPYRPQGDFERPWRDRLRSRYDLDRDSYFDGETQNYRSRWRSEDEDRWEDRPKVYNKYEDDYYSRQARNQYYDSDSNPEVRGRGMDWDRLRNRYNYDHQFDQNPKRDYDREDWEDNYSRFDYESDRGRWNEEDDWENRWQNDDRNQRFNQNTRYSEPETPEWDSRVNRYQNRYTDEDSFENVGNYGGRYSSRQTRESRERQWRPSRRYTDNTNNY